MRKVDSFIKESVKEQLNQIQLLQVKVAEQLANITTVEVQGIKFTHKGSINKRFVQNSDGVIENKILKENQANLLANVENYHLQYERVDFSSSSDTVIMIKSGEVILK